MNSRDNNSRNRNDSRLGGYSNRRSANRSVRGFGDENISSNRNQRGATHQGQIGFQPHPQQPPSIHQSIPITSFPGLSPSDQADLDTFRAALTELTFNSLPIIEKLTEMARERAKNIAGPISRTILDNLVFNHPKLKSCFLFLIDSISKNVGDPYPASFVKHGLVSAYLRVYGEIRLAGDEGQKRDFLRVLPTWKGVFAPEALREIESKLSANPTTQIVASPPTISPQTVKLLKDLQSVFINPPGPHISGIVTEIFNRLHRGGELRRETLEDLDAKAKIADKRQIIEAIRLILMEKRAEPEVKTRTESEVKTRTELEAKVKTEPNTTTISDSTNTNSTNSPFNFELPPNFQLDLSLLSSIVELNKLSGSGNTTTTTTTSSSSSSETPIAVNLIEIPVTSADLLQSHPNLFKLLYDDLELHCKTCGIRFKDTPKGQERMTAHLDSHFRRNMRLKEKSKRVMARDWFGSENDWISGKIDSETSAEKSVKVFEESNELDESSQINNQESSDIFVEASESEQASQVKCSICQEIISVTWNDEREQWIFPACIRNESNQIVHFACENDPEPIKKKQKSK